MQKFKKKAVPTLVKALQFTGHNDAECLAFCPIARDPIDKRANLIIPTGNSETLCSIGDWIVKEIEVFVVYTKVSFEETYEAVYQPEKISFTITANRGDKKDWNRDYFIASCLETGSITTADDCVTAVDMMLELLRGELEYAVKNNNIAGLFN